MIYNRANIFQITSSVTYHILTKYVDTKQLPSLKKRWKTKNRYTEK